MHCARIEKIVRGDVDERPMSRSEDRTGSDRTQPVSSHLVNKWMYISDKVLYSVMEWQASLSMSAAGSCDCHGVDAMGLCMTKSIMQSPSIRIVTSR